MSEDKLSDEEMEIAMKALHDVWNSANGIHGGVVGGHLGSPISERLKDRKNYHDSEDGLMSPNSIDDIPEDVWNAAHRNGRDLSPEEVEAIKAYTNVKYHKTVPTTLQCPTPEQIDHDIIGQLSMFQQEIADLETARVFHMACIENLVERLNDLEQKSQFRFAEGFHKGRESVLRTNQSGCCCILNDSDEIISVCGAHEQWEDSLLKQLNKTEEKLKAIEQQFLEILSHGCCIPVCSKHQGPIEGNG